MTARSSQKDARDWYSVSIDSVRTWTVLVLLVILGGAGYFGFVYWNETRTERSAFETVAKATSLQEQLLREAKLSDFQAPFQMAAEELESARASLSANDYPRALRLGEASFTALQEIFDQIFNRTHAGIAWFVSVEGDVQYRRGDSGEFLRAFPRGVLHEGDYVRSGSGSSAEIYFSTEETRFTLRPGSLFKLSSAAEVAQKSLGFMEYGWVGLNTAQSTSSVKTKYSEVTVASHSSASVSLEDGSESSEIRVQSGGATVLALESGETTELSERQLVVQRADDLGSVQDLLAPPEPLAPEDNLSINLDRMKEVELKWRSVAGARRYALQVSRSRLFGSNLVDSSDRTGTTATLALLDEGSYLWRMASYDRQGRQGPWSDPVGFRVASYQGLDLAEDHEAPVLSLEVLVNGKIAILKGVTEPGSKLTMDDEPIDVAANGEFATSRVLYGVGQVPLVFRAVDAAGNATIERRWVYLDED